MKDKILEYLVVTGEIDELVTKKNKKKKPKKKKKSTN